MANADIYAHYDEADTFREPGTFTGTRFHDIMPNDVVVPGARLSARLCNFPTNLSTLRLSHRNWIRDFVQPAVKSFVSPWIDLMGYASQLRRDGSQALNVTLSGDRCRKVREEIANYSDRLHWNVQWARGAATSGVDPQGTQNDGWWRSVVINVFGYRPPTVTPATVSGFQDFEISLIEGASVGVTLKELPISPFPELGGYLFEIVALRRGKKIEKARFAHAAGAWNLGTTVNPSPVSITRGTGPTAFHTSVPVELHDFAGEARLFGDPALSIFGGAMRISFESDSLARLAAVIRGGNIVEINNTNDPGAATLGSAGLPGPLKMIGTTVPVP